MPVGYETGTTYPWKSKLPTWDELGKVLEWVPRSDWEGGQAFTQLVIRTRVDLGHPGNMHHSLSDEASAYHRRVTMLRWNTWFQRMRQLREDSATRRMRDESTWRLVSSQGPVPEEAVLLPPTWTIRVCFRSGDYGAMVDEVMWLRHTGKDVHLYRRFRNGTPGWPTKDPDHGRLRWQRWHGLTPVDADRIAVAVGYVADRPWLMYTKHNVGALEFPRLPGRPYGLYCNGDSWSLRDGNGFLWWNATHTFWRDPDAWKNAPGEHRPSLLTSAVWAFLIKQFPDTTRSNGVTPGWIDVSGLDESRIDLLRQELIAPMDGVIGCPGDHLQEAIAELGTTSLDGWMDSKNRCLAQWEAFAKDMHSIPIDLRHFPWRFSGGYPSPKEVESTITALRASAETKPPH